MARAERVPLQFGFQSRPGRYGADGSNRLINCYSEEAGPEGKGKEKVQQYATEGLRPVVTLPDGPVRGGHAAGESLFVLSGRTLYRVRPDWSYDAIGQVAAGTRAAFARNRREAGPEIVLVSGGAAYLLTVSPDFEPISFARVDDPDLDPVLDVTFIDGYFAYALRGKTGGRFVLSGVDNGGAISALDQATAESDPDQIVRVVRHKGELWLAGERTMEVWSNNGNANFPYIRVPGVAIDRGCMAAGSVALLEEMIFWVADDGTVRRTENYAGMRVSHHSVERSILAEPDKSGITALSYTVAGHSLYVLSGSTFTWVYDHAMSVAAGSPVWHERRTFRRPRWRAELALRYRDQTVVGDRWSGDLYVVDPQYGFDGHEPLVMTMRGPIQNDFPHKMQFFDLFLDIVPGVGKLTGSLDDTNPHVMCRYSDDGGQTWSNERRGAIGKRGESRKRIKFGKLGQSSSAGRIMEFSISAGVARAFLGASAKMRRIRQR